MIRRIEIDKRGGVCLQIGQGHAWYDISTFPPHQLDPLDDPQIPLSALARGRRLDVNAPGFTVVDEVHQQHNRGDR